MRYYSIYDLVGIQVSDAYPWCETLFLIHAAALEKDGKVLLLPSWGGEGYKKTIGCTMRRTNSLRFSK